jgi:hypothetical protein
MLDTFKARLKAKTKAAGVNLSKERINAIADRLHKKNPAVTEDSEHDTLIDDLDELISFKDIAKQDDKVRTLEARKPATDPDDVEDDEPTETENQQTKKPGKKKPSPNDELTTLVKSLAETVNKLTTEKVQSSIRSKVDEKLKDAVPAKFYSKRPLPEKEEDLEDYIAEIESDWKELKQDGNNSGLAGVSTPAGATSTAKATGKEDSVIDSWASSKAPVQDTTKK